MSCRVQRNMPAPVYANGARERNLGLHECSADNTRKKVKIETGL